MVANVKVLVKLIFLALNIWRIERCRRIIAMSNDENDGPVTSLVVNSETTAIKWRRFS